MFLVGDDTDKLMVRREYFDSLSKEAFCDWFKCLFNVATRITEGVYPNSFASRENGESNVVGLGEKEEFEIYGWGSQLVPGEGG